MEGLFFFIILIVFSLLRGGARQRRQQQQTPPPRPRRPVLDPGAEEPREDRSPFPPARPARQRVLIDENIYRFPKKESVRPKAPKYREEPSPIEAEEIAAPEMQALDSSPKAGRAKEHVLFKERSDLARGIILAEVLGPPLSKRKKRGFV